VIEGQVGSKSWRNSMLPLTPKWFVGEGEKLYLLPVQGSDTQWYRNVLKNPSIRVDGRGAETEFRGVSITDAETVNSVVEKFREKYGAKDVKNY
jgi:hypothetical protein